MAGARMNYRVDCLTPLLVSDGATLSPIDYMVWKDQVNVLDQRKIFRLLAKGPRLDGYLNQVKRAEKLDFASWGGFAQNFAGRRIAFEHASISPQWERQPADACHIPTFTRTHEGAYLTGSSLRGALRTALVSARLDEKVLEQIRETMAGEHPPRRIGDALEQRALANDGGRGGMDPLKAFAVSDSRVLAASGSTKVYLVRVASLAESRDPKTQAARPFSLVWKQSRGGSVESRRIDDSTPLFAEMAPPGTVFEGSWAERAFYRKGEIRHVLRWRDTDLRKALIEAANAYAARALAAHRQFAAAAGMAALDASLADLEAHLAEARQAGDRCLLSLGWGAGLLSKAAWPVAAPEAEESHRRLLAAQSTWARAIRTGMPFPKTRRVIFLQGQPAALPGWVTLTIS
jgi:CRISPR-associated protein Csm5